MWAYKPHPSESFRSKTESVQGCTRPNSSGTRMSECDLQSLSSSLYPQIQVDTEPCNFKKEHINEMTKHYCLLWSQTWWTVIRHNIVWQINILFRNTVSSGIKSIQLVISITDAQWCIQRYMLVAYITAAWLCSNCACTLDLSPRAFYPQIKFLFCAWCASPLALAPPLWLH